MALQLLPINEACARLALSRTALYDLMRSGALPYVKIRRARRIREDALERLIETGTVASRPADTAEAES